MLKRPVKDIVGDVVHVALVDDAPCGQSPYGPLVHLLDWWAVLGRHHNIFRLWERSGKYAGSDMSPLQFALCEPFACMCRSGVGGLRLLQT